MYIILFFFFLLFYLFLFIRFKSHISHLKKYSIFACIICCCCTAVPFCYIHTQWYPPKKQQSNPHFYFTIPGSPHTLSRLSGSVNSCINPDFHFLYKRYTYFLCPPPFFFICPPPLLTLFPNFCIYSTLLIVLPISL